MVQSTKQKRRSTFVFCVYLILLVWLILFKFALHPSQIPEIRSINLIPFASNQVRLIHAKEVIYNIMAFIPLGIYVQIFRPTWNKLHKIAFIMTISCCFELFQFIFAIGATDITDVLSNTTGGIIGLLSCGLLKRIASEKYIGWINGLGLFIEIAAAALIVLLVIGNLG